MSSQEQQPLPGQPGQPMASGDQKNGNFDELMWNHLLSDSDSDWENWAPEKAPNKGHVALQSPRSQMQQQGVAVTAEQSEDKNTQSDTSKSRPQTVEERARSAGDGLAGANLAATISQARGEHFSKDSNVSKKSYYSSDDPVEQKMRQINLDDKANATVYALPRRPLNLKKIMGPRVTATYMLMITLTIVVLPVFVWVGTAYFTGDLLTQGLKKEDFGSLSVHSNLAVGKSQTDASLEVSSADSNSNILRITTVQGQEVVTVTNSTTGETNSTIVTTNSGETKQALEFGTYEGTGSIYEAGASITYVTTTDTEGGILSDSQRRKLQDDDDDETDRPLLRELQVESVRVAMHCTERCGIVSQDTILMIAEDSITVEASGGMLFESLDAATSEFAGGLSDGTGGVGRVRGGHGQHGGIGEVAGGDASSSNGRGGVAAVTGGAGATGGEVQITSGSSSSGGSSGDVRIFSGDSSSAVGTVYVGGGQSANDDGGDAVVVSGSSSSSTKSGGVAAVRGAPGLGGSTGGGAEVSSGSGVVAGDVNIFAGDSTGEFGGSDVYVFGGRSSMDNTSGGDVIITGGELSPSTDDEAGSGGDVMLFGGPNLGRHDEDRGGDVGLEGGAARNIGGHAVITGGPGMKEGGNVVLSGGSGEGSTGGTLALEGGTDVLGGDVEIEGGVGAFGTGGTVRLQGGIGASQVMVAAPTFDDDQVDYDDFDDVDGASTEEDTTTEEDEAETLSAGNGGSIEIVGGAGSGAPEEGLQSGSGGDVILASGLKGGSSIDSSGSNGVVAARVGGLEGPQSLLLTDTDTILAAPSGSFRVRMEDTAGPTALQLSDSEFQLNLATSLKFLAATELEFTGSQHADLLIHRSGVTQRGFDAGAIKIQSGDGGLTSSGSNAPGHKGGAVTLVAGNGTPAADAGGDTGQGGDVILVTGSEGEDSPGSSTGPGDVRVKIGGEDNADYVKIGADGAAFGLLDSSSKFEIYEGDVDDGSRVAYVSSTTVVFDDQDSVYFHSATEVGIGKHTADVTLKKTSVENSAAGDFNIEGQTGVGTGGDVLVTAGLGETGVGGDLHLNGGTSEAESGGDVFIASGLGFTDKSSGDVSISTGNGGATSGAAGAINLSVGDNFAGTAGGVVINGGNHVAANSGSGGTINILAGDSLSTDAVSAKPAGDVLLAAGDAEGTNAEDHGGDASLLAGDAVSGDGGNLSLAAGDTTDGTAGDATLLAGESTNGDGGDVVIGSGAGGGSNGAVRVLRGATTIVEISSGTTTSVTDGTLELTADSGPVDISASSILTVDGETGVTLTASTSGDVLLSSVAGTASLSGATGVTIQSANTGGEAIVLEATGGASSDDIIVSTDGGDVRVESSRQVALSSSHQTTITSSHTGTDAIVISASGTASTDDLALTTAGGDLRVESSRNVAVSADQAITVESSKTGSGAAIQVNALGTNHVDDISITTAGGDVIVESARTINFDGESGATLTAQTGPVLFQALDGAATLDGEDGVTIIGSRSGGNNVEIEAQGAGATDDISVTAAGGSFLVDVANGVTLDGAQGATLTASTSGELLVDAVGGTTTIDGHTGVTIQTASDGSASGSAVLVHASGSTTADDVFVKVDTGDFRVDAGATVHLDGASGATIVTASGDIVMTATTGSQTTTLGGKLSMSTSETGGEAIAITATGTNAADDIRIQSSGGDIIVTSSNEFDFTATNAVSLESTSSSVEVVSASTATVSAVDVVVTSSSSTTLDTNEINVGQNGALTVQRTARTSAGAGTDLLMVGQAGNSGTSAGGDIRVRPGQAAGGGTDGVILVEDASGGTVVEFSATTVDAQGHTIATTGAVNSGTATSTTSVTTPLLLSTTDTINLGDDGAFTLQRKAATGAATAFTIAGQDAGAGSGGAGGNIVISPGAADGAGAKSSLTLQHSDGSGIMHATNAATDVIQLGFDDALTFQKPQHTTSSGSLWLIQGQAGASGAFDGGNIVIEMGAKGNGASDDGEVRIEDSSNNEVFAATENRLTFGADGAIINYGAKDTATIATGAITITKSYHHVEGEGSAEDDLTTVTHTDATAGDTVMLTFPDYNIRILETGNILINDNGDTGDVMQVGGDYSNMVQLLFDGTKWIVENGEASGAAILTYEDGDRDTVATMYTLIRETSDGSNGDDGIGSAFDWHIENSAGEVELSASMDVLLTDAIDGQEESQFVWSTRNAATVKERLSLDNINSVTTLQMTADNDDTSQFIMTDGTDSYTIEADNVSPTALRFKATSEANLYLVAGGAADTDATLTMTTSSGSASYTWTADNDATNPLLTLTSSKAPYLKVNSASLDTTLHLAQGGSNKKTSIIMEDDSNTWTWEMDSSDTSKLKLLDTAGTEIITTTTAGLTGFGTVNDPQRVIHIDAADASTDSVTYPLRITHTTSNTPAAGIGVGIEFDVETGSVGATSRAAAIEALVTQVTDADVESALVFKTKDGTQASDANMVERMRIDKDGYVGVGMSPTTNFEVSGEIQSDNVHATTDLLTPTAKVDTLQDQAGTSAMTFNGGVTDIVQNVILSATIDHDSNSNTNVNIDSGNIDGTIIGAVSEVAGTFSTLTAKTSIVSEGDLTVQGDLTINDGQDVVLDTTTGTTFGTAASQKLAFFGATPIAQPSGVADASTDGADGTAHGTAAIGSSCGTSSSAEYAACAVHINSGFTKLNDLGNDYDDLVTQYNGLVDKFNDLATKFNTIIAGLENLGIVSAV